MKIYLEGNAVGHGIIATDDGHGRQVRRSRTRRETCKMVESKEKQFIVTFDSFFFVGFFFTVSAGDEDGQGNHKLHGWICF